MKIVGVGCGPNLLTEEAISALRGARTCYGSERAIQIAAPFLRPDCEIHRVTDYRTLRDLRDTEAVVLSTGDPMLGGLGYLSGEVIPGISSLQLACARQKISWLKVIPLSAHAKDPRSVFQELWEEILRGKIVFLLADPEFDIIACAEFLRDHGLSCDIAICENLGYPEERITMGSIEAPPPIASPLFSLVIGNFR